MARGRCVAMPAPGALGPFGQSRADRLGTCQPRQRFRPGQRGGEAVGRNPTDRGKQGSKRHLVSDGGGDPLAIVLTAANVHDSAVFKKLIDSVEPIKRPKGRPRKRPNKLHADKAYDARKCRQALRKRRIKSRIARKGKEASGWAVTGGW